MVQNNVIQTPQALFDSLAHIADISMPSNQPHFNPDDFVQALAFLRCYIGSQGTFNSYRRDIERLLHWCWQVAAKSLAELKRDDIEAFIRFCQNPPISWIGVKKAARFIEKDGLRVSNPEWRPFVATISKVKHRQGETPDQKQFSLSQGAIKESFAILSSFFNYLLQEEYAMMNPVALIRQKSKFIRKQQGKPKIRRLSELQWQYTIDTAKKMAEKNPQQHERTLFIMSILYAMYLRISELTTSERWTPMMNDFYRDSDNHWWFTTVGKGNKQRQIAVSDATLEALKRWRQHLGLSIVPSPADDSPLIPKSKGKGPMSSTNHIRKIVQACFDYAIVCLQKDTFNEDAQALAEATVHWLRHTGISDDVKRRPREHVRDDAGHGSGAVTDGYIDVELKERHLSAKNKPIFDV